MQLHLLANFMVGVLIASWILASSTIATWSKFLKRYTHDSFLSENRGSIEAKTNKSDQP